MWDNTPLLVACMYGRSEAAWPHVAASDTNVVYITAVSSQAALRLIKRGANIFARSTLVFAYVGGPLQDVQERTWCNPASLCRGGGQH